MANEILIPGAQVMLDGATVTNLAATGAGRAWLTAFVQRNRPKSWTHEVATGGRILYHQSRSTASVWRESALYLHDWIGGKIYADAQGLETLHDRLTATYAHNMVTGARDYCRLTVDGTSTVCRLKRQILGAGYTRTAERGVNGGAAAIDIQVRDYAGTVYTVDYGGAPIAGHVAVTVAGTYAWRELTFNAADIAAIPAANRQDAIRVRAVWLYRVRAEMGEIGFEPGGGNVCVWPIAEIEELGEPN